MLFSHLAFLEVDGQNLAAAPITLIGEDTNAGIDGISFADINGDGLPDIVENTSTKEGGIAAPEVYLNENNGVFVHVDPNIFPNSPYPYGNIKYESINGENDFLYFSASFQNSPTHPELIVPLQSFPNGVFSMSSRDFADNIGTLQNLENTGGIASIKIADSKSVRLDEADILNDAALIAKLQNAEFDPRVAYCRQYAGRLQ